MICFAITSQIRSNLSHEEDKICVNNNCESQSKVGNVKRGGGGGGGGGDWTTYILWMIS